MNKKLTALLTEAESLIQNSDNHVQLEKIIIEARILSEQAPLTPISLQNQALEATTNGIVITDTDGKIQWINPAFTQLTGYTLKEIIGQTPRILKSGQHDETFYKEMWKTITAGKVWHGELINQTKDGHLINCNMTISPIQDAQEKITHFIGIKQDTTEQKKAKKALQALSQRNALILNSVAEGICGLDCNGKLMFINQAALNMIGWQAEELQGKIFHQMVHHTKPEGSPYPIEECPSRSTIKNGEACHRDDEVFWRKDGSAFPVEYYTNPMHDDNQQINGVVLTFLDITLRKAKTRKSCPTSH